MKKMDLTNESNSSPTTASLSKEILRLRQGEDVDIFLSWSEEEAQLLGSEIHSLSFLNLRIAKNTSTFFDLLKGDHSNTLSKKFRKRGRIKSRTC